MQDEPSDQESHVRVSEHRDETVSGVCCQFLAREMVQVKVVLGLADEVFHIRPLSVLENNLLFRQLMSTGIGDPAKEVIVIIESKETLSFCFSRSHDNEPHGRLFQ